MDSEVSTRPDLSNLEVPIDSWTSPFWEAAAAQRLVLPRCGDCQRFRWPPGPFCAHCCSQRVEWLPAGTGRVYSYTILRKNRATGASDSSRLAVPALIEFPEAGGVRLLAAIVDTPLSSIRIGVLVEPDWSQAVNATVPVFKVRQQ
jgi:uncharacterized OB-fold protein